MTTAIEVLSVRPVERGSLRAVARVRLAGCIEVADIRVIQQERGAAWLGLPQAPARRKADGSGSGWTAIVTITDSAVLDRLRDAVLAAWRERAP